MKLGVEEIDGRPLYQYRMSLQSAGLHELNSIEMWEMLIEKPNSRDDQVARFLAPVAAANRLSAHQVSALTSRRGSRSPSLNLCAPQREGTSRKTNCSSGDWQVQPSLGQGLARRT